MPGIFAFPTGALNYWDGKIVDQAQTSRNRPLFAAVGRNG